MSDPAFKTITEDEVRAWIRGGKFASPMDVAVSWMAQILNGEYPLHEARSDVVSLRAQQQEVT